MRYALTTRYRDSTTQVIFEPEDFMVRVPVRRPFGAAFGGANRQSRRFVIARLAARVPDSRAHLTRYHGMFAPETPTGRGPCPAQARPLPTSPASAGSHRPPTAKGPSPGPNGSSGFLPPPVVPSVDASHQFTLSASIPAAGDPTPSSGPLSSHKAACASCPDRSCPCETSVGSLHP